MNSVMTVITDVGQFRSSNEVTNTLLEMICAKSSTLGKKLIETDVEAEAWCEAIRSDRMMAHTITLEFQSLRRDVSSGTKRTVVEGLVVLRRDAKTT